MRFIGKYTSTKKRHGDLHKVGEQDRKCLRAMAEHLRSIVAEQEWTGTTTQLAGMLNLPRPDAPSSEEHLAIWLRRHEPALWWHHGIFVRFSRTGKRRLVHLARRGLTADVHDGNNVSLAVTPSE